jgi:tripartite ATP-independent transporter DctM subunit
MMVLSYVFARKYNYPRDERFRLQRVWETAKDASWAFLLPLIILGGIFTGLVTATEGAGLAVVAAIGVGLIYREFDMKLMRQALMEGGIQTAVVMVLVATSAVLSMVLTELQLPQKLAQSMIHWTNNSYLVLLILNVFFLILGCFLHSAAAIILTVPIVMPLVTAVGIDPVHFGIVLTINLGIGQQTPPVASVLITACAISKEDVWEVTKVNIWYIGVMVLVLVLVTYFPMLSLWPLKVFY